MGLDTRVGSVAIEAKSLSAGDVNNDQGKSSGSECEDQNR